MAGRRSDRDRILLLLTDSEGLSNIRVKTELNLGDERYQQVRRELLEEGLIEKYVCRGGGIRLTRKGERSLPGSDEEPTSTVDRESSLYEPLVDFLERQAEEDGTTAVIADTHSLKVRGQWQNPDIVRISVEHYKYLCKMRVVVTTYEVKQFPRWDVSAVYEAASHHRFSHEAIVVLEWPNGAGFSLTDPTYRLDQLARECQRFGVGLATLRPYYSSYRLYPHIEPRPLAPDDEDVESWLDYALSRTDDARTRLHNAINSVRAVLNGKRKDDDDDDDGW